MILIDSMQVYKEIPIITNQRRSRPAELTGIVSVTDKWTMALHRRACDEITNGVEVPFVLDAGTGMYLNAILFDIPISSRVSPETRRRAETMSSNEQNPRRAARETELALSGNKRTQTIWDGSLRYDFELLYIRPGKDKLDGAISSRSSRIAQQGLAEVIELLERFPIQEVNHSVRDSIGVKELVSRVKGEKSQEEATERIAARTRQLARRQMRWFDKLAKTLRDRAKVLVTEDPASAKDAVETYANKLQE